MKRCPRCESNKSLSEYHKGAPYCKPCTRVYEAARYKERGVSERKQRQIKRLKILLMYGNECACCGEKESLFLEIDHIHGGGTKQRKLMTPDGYYTWLKAERREGFQVLCSNCNRGKWRNHGICPHKQKELQ